MIRYPLRPLGEVLSQRKEFIEIDDLTAYKRVRVRLHAQGVELRDVVLGSDLKTKSQQTCRADDVIFAEIDAKVGGYGVVPAELEGAIVSSHYFLFELDHRAADMKYIGYALRAPTFQEQVAARGSTNYAPIRPQHVLEYEVPLPSLDEQRHVGARLDLVTQKLAKVSSLSSSSLLEAEAMVASTLGSWLAETRCPTRVLSSHAEVYRGKGPRYATDTSSWAINQACVRWDGLDLAQAREVDPLWVESLQDWAFIQAEDVLVNSTGEGTIGRACVVEPAAPALPFDSHVLVVRTDPQHLVPSFLVMYLRSPQGQAAIKEAKSANTTKQTELGKQKLEQLPIPLPEVSAQRQFVRRYEKLRDVSSRLVALRRASLLSTEAIGASVLNRALAGEL